ncbi:hypothetical protein [uncultured Thomasclavelia sp.]|uniref:hypothetical protein n=1 Tax=uncultured Thomasclavelia sp. TaxID=3025759 RepID=UPI00261B0B2C|nr:hypothetical protein [uncultured Thomasclavelia sp.]
MSRKDKISFFISMLLLTIFIAILILVFCWLCYELPVDFPGTVGEWVTALASLAGGALTLGGVWWTIKDSNKQRRTDLIVQYKPILVCSSNKIKDMNGEMLYINIIFENLGRGEAVDVNLQYFQKNQKNEYALHPFNISEDILAPNCKFTFSGALLRNNNHEINNNVLKQKEVLPIENDKNFNFTASLSYKNPIDNNIQYFIEFDFEIFQAISEKDHIKIKTFNERPDDLEKEWYVKIANIRYSKKKNKF